MLKKIFIILFLIFIVAGCKFWTNFSTYFNTYYNADRLIKKTEQEFEYFDETKRIEPRALAPEYGIIELDNFSQEGVPPFMQEFVISQAKLQPVKIKLDSVLIKGSKILARKSKSEYIEGTLYLMALAYFYKGEWLPSQVKCGELIDIYPAGKKSPDAHLLFAKSLLIQRKWEYGKKMLSRTVDIAWQLKRYDILSEAFRLHADLSLYKGDREGAMRPYLQAIAQSNSKELKGKWQIEMASLLYELQQYERAELAFEKANKAYRPDYQGMFEAYLYEAECAARLGKFEKSDEILRKLEKDGKFEEWKDFTFIGRMDLLRMMYNMSEDTTGLNQKLMAAEKTADSLYPNNKLHKIYQYERAMEYYKKGDYTNAESYFAKARAMRSPAFSQSNAMYTYISQINRNRKILNNERIGKESIVEFSVDTISTSSESNTITKDSNNEPKKVINPSKEIANAAYVIARTYEKLKEPDSLLFYYEMALQRSDTSHIDNARYLYAVAINIQEKHPRRSDSLLQLIVDRFPKSEYAAITGKMLGFTEAYALDSVKEYFKSATELRRQKMFKESIKEYLNIYKFFPEDELAPKSVYSIAWIYENGLKKLDSALFYYKLLQDKYPNSEYAKELALSIVYLENKIIGTEIPDSLTYAKMKKEIIKIDPVVKQPVILDKDDKEDKKNLLNKAKDSFKNFFKEKLDDAKSAVDSAKSKYDKIKDMDLDSLNFKDLVDPKKLLPGQDSTSNNNNNDTTKSPIAPLDSNSTK
jgi:tetratricopeptide (TPR) repeat protein